MNPIVNAGRMAAILKEIVDRLGDDAELVMNEVNNLAVLTADGVYVGYIDFADQELVWLSD